MKKLLFLVTALLAMVQQSSAQTTPVITVDDVEAVPGETVAFSLNLTGGRVNQYTALQFDVQFPATGFTTITGGYTVNTSVWLGVSCVVGDVDATGLATIPFASSEAITAADVENLVSVSFQVDSEVAVGEYDVTLKKIFLAYNTSDRDEPADVTFKVKVVERHTVVLDELSTTAPTAAEDVNVRVNRTINANEWSTICLPFAMNAEQCQAAFGEGVQLADFTSYTKEEDNNEIISITVNFTSVNSIEANHPYIVKVENDVNMFTVLNVDIDPKEEPCVEYTNGQTGKKKHVFGKFMGTYVADFDFYNEADYYPLFLSGNLFYYATENTKHMKAFRAYFDFEDYLDEAEEASARMLLSFDGETTSIENSSLFQPKAAVDGWYTLDGRKLDKKPTEKGVYIKNNKKVVIR